MVKDSIIALIKPTHNCNLNCSYCYDANERASSCNIMSTEMVSKTAYLLKNAYANVNWTWHGGEPLTIPKEQYIEYHKAIEEAELNPRFCLQTNGTLLNKEWRDILNDLEIHPSISYDFTNKNKNRGHSMNIGRMDPLGKYGVINVIDFESSKELISIYETTKLSSRGVSFNKIFLNSEMDDNVVEYTENWIKYYNHYIFDNDAKRMDRSFFAYFNKLFEIYNNNGMCDLNNCLNNFISVSPDGNIYHCDRFGNISGSKYCFGNVMDYEFTMLEYKESEGYKKMLRDILEFNKSCSKCEIVNICSGGCLGNRVNKNGVIDLTIKNESGCYFDRKIFSFIFDTIFNLKKEQLIELNPFIYEKIFEEKIILKFMIPEIQEGVLDENINFD